MIQDTFHYLAGALRFTYSTLTMSEDLYWILEEIEKPDNLENFGRLTAAKQNTLTTVLQLQIQVREQLNEFSQQVQAVENNYRNLKRVNYEQQWLRWQREMDNLRVRIQQLDTILKRNYYAATEQQWQEIESQYKYTRNQDNRLEGELKQLRKEESRYREQIERTLGQVMQILRKAKIEQDLKGHLSEEL